LVYVSVSRSASSSTRHFIFADRGFGFNVVVPQLSEDPKFAAEISAVPVILLVLFSVVVLAAIPAR